LDIIDRTISKQDLESATIGKIDPESLPQSHKADMKKQRAEELASSKPATVAEPLGGKPPLDAMINIFDFEKAGC